MTSTLHRRLVDRQTTEELERKADKAYERKARLWTQEEIDYIERISKELSEALKWE